MELATPTVVYGHSVRNEHLACTGCSGRYSAYAIEASTLAVLRITEDSAGTAPDQYVCSLEQPAVEVISCISIHPVSDVLCVGTASHGLYVTKASRPEFSSQTRLPFSVTGERIFSACFMQLSPSATALVFSSSFPEKKGPMPHRLSLWHHENQQLLWRGAMEPLTSVSHLGIDGAFAACAGPRLYLFTAQCSSATGAEKAEGQPTVSGQAAGSSRQRVVVLSRQCTSVPQLEGAEYIQCLAVVAADGGDGEGEEETGGLYALTTNGFLVAFDVATGSVSRWMDCKVCPATSLRMWGRYLVLTGALVRFFRAGSWKFCGKIRPSPSATPVVTGAAQQPSPAPALDAVLGDTLVSTFVPARGRHHLLFFSRGGSYVQYRCRTEEASARSNGDDEHVSVERVGAFAPLVALARPAAASAGDARWLVADGAFSATQLDDGSSGGASAAVWTRAALAALEPTTRTTWTLQERTGCAAYHDGARCVLAFMTAQEQWMAFNFPAQTTGAESTSTLWQPCGALAWSCDKDSEPMHIAVSPTTGDVAVLCEGNGVTQMLCTRTSPTAVVLRRARSQRAHCRAPLVKLLYVLDRLYGITAQSIVPLGTDLSSEEFPISEGIVDACGTLRDVAVVHARGAYLYRTDRTGRCVPVPVPDPVALGRLPLRSCQYDFSTDCLALANDTQVLLYRAQQQPLQLLQRLVLAPTPERPLASSSSSSSSPLPVIRAVAVQGGNTPVHVRLYVLNSTGQSAVYGAVVGEPSPSPTPTRGASEPARESLRDAQASYRPATRLLPAREGERIADGRPPLVAAAHMDPAAVTASRRARRSTSAAAPTSHELQNRFNELNGYYEHQKQLEALTPRAGRRATGRHSEATTTGAAAAAAAASAAAATRSASAPLRGTRAPRTVARAPGPQASEAAPPSPSGSPPRPQPYATTAGSKGGAVRASSLSAVEVSAMSDSSAPATPVQLRTGAGADGGAEATVAVSGEYTPDVRPFEASGRPGVSPSRRAPVPIFAPDQDVSVGSDASSVATTFSIRARTLRQSLVDLQQLLDDDHLRDDVNSTEDLADLTHLLESVAASLQTLHHQTR